MLKYHYNSISFNVEGLGTFYKAQITKACNWAGVVLERWSCYITEEQYNKFKGRKTISEQELQEILGGQVKMTEQELLERIKELEEAIQDQTEVLNKQQDFIHELEVKLQDLKTAHRVLIDITRSKLNCHHKD